MPIALITKILNHFMILRMNKNRLRRTRWRTACQWKSQQPWKRYWYDYQIWNWNENTKYPPPNVSHSLLNFWNFEDLFLLPHFSKVRKLFEFARVCSRPCNNFRWGSPEISSRTSLELPVSESMKYLMLCKKFSQIFKMDINRIHNKFFKESWFRWFYIFLAKQSYFLFRIFL